jgi:large subunit ribosomal protein L3
MTEVVRRVGLIGVKLGMSQIYDGSGRAVPVTLVQAKGNSVLGVKTSAKHGYNSVIVGYGKKKPSRVTRAIKGICAAAKVEPVEKIKEFRVSENALLNPGAEISITHFVEGQHIDASGVSIGKGFAGVVKKYGFGGQNASHGTSLTHRSAGSTGQCQDPGKVIKGKKMAGHMGNVSITIQNLKVIRIDEELGVIAIEGAIPGHKGSYVYLQDAIKMSVPGGAAFPAALAGQGSKAATQASTISEDTATNQESSEA